MDWVADLDEQFSSLADSGRTRFEFGEILDEASWQTPNPFEDATSFWLPYATALVEKGQLDKARAIAKPITDAATLITILADRRFDAIVASDKKRFEPRLAAEARLAKMQREATNAQDRMEGQIAVARALHMLGRNDEASRVLNAAVAKWDQSTTSRRKPFADIDSQGANALIWKGEILLALGKIDDGFASLRRAASALRGDLQLNFDARFTFECPRPPRRSAGAPFQHRIEHKPEAASRHGRDTRLHAQPAEPHERGSSGFGPLVPASTNPTYRTRRRSAVHERSRCRGQDLYRDAA